MLDVTVVSKLYAGPSSVADQCVNAYSVLSVLSFDGTSSSVAATFPPYSTSFVSIVSPSASNVTVYLSLL